MLLPLVTAACATSVAYHPQRDCAAGSAGACVDWGDELVTRGDTPAAEAAYGQACEGGISTSCIAQGQLLMKRPAELNGFIGYQHFASTWAVPYVRMMLGGIPAAPPGTGFNYGGELGLKLCLGPIGHLEFAAGSSRASPLHASVGLGLNAIFLLLLGLR
ncbi:hypothetical protein F0U61_27055 [Archangium violaceum]|uniref:hypothetical protein n=1 Tax=Archangium violaceum TaxID=83451 RepID=UPI002B2C0B25|nr:hypothetical protein F0U61_27055 [Archangium violaceum]